MEQNNYSYDFEKPSPIDYLIACANFFHNKLRRKPTSSKLEDDSDPIEKYEGNSPEFTLPKDISKQLRIKQ